MRWMEWKRRGRCELVMKQVKRERASCLARGWVVAVPPVESLGTCAQRSSCFSWFASCNEEARINKHIRASALAWL